MAESYMLTTVDNPFNPFIDFDNWYDFDVNKKGYNCSAYLARVARNSSALSDAENDEENERAIDEILKYDTTGLYKKVTKDSKIIPIEIETK